MIAHRHWGRFEKRSLSIIVTKRDPLDDTKRHRQQTDRQTDRETESVGVGVVCGVWCDVTYFGAMMGAVSVSMVLMVWWRVVIFVFLDFAMWEAFLFVFFDGLRGGQKDDEEVFSEPCQSSSEEEKGQDTTSEKWKKLRLRSWTFSKSTCFTVFFRENTKL